jgi:hypothetical protein
MSTGFQTRVASSRKTKAARRKELEAEFGAAVAAHAVALHRQRVAVEQGLDPVVCDAAVAEAAERRQRAKNMLMQHVLPGRRPQASLSATESPRRE